MKSIVLRKTVLLILASGLVSCAHNGGQPSALADNAAKPPTIPFNDIQSFDSKLNGTLAKRPEKLVVTLEDRVTLKEMPTRINKWLTAVDNTGGKVVVLPLDSGEKQEIKTRALPLLSLFSVFGALREFVGNMTYSPAKDYNAVIYYKRDDTGDRLVDHVEMVRRTED